MSPRTTALTYLAFIRGEKANVLLLATVAFLIATLNGKIDSLAENIYEVSFLVPSQCRSTTLIAARRTSRRCCV